MFGRDLGVIMNKLIVSSVALVASLAGSAMAADMQVKAPVVVESWTGLYVGVALGGRFSDSTWTTNCLSAGAPGGVGCPLNFVAQNGARFLNDNPSGFSSATFKAQRISRLQLAGRELGSWRRRRCRVWPG